MNSSSKSMDGDALRNLVAAGEAALARNVEAVNALNVFPVPDGDTGTNMLLTLRAVQEEAVKAAGGSAGVAAGAIARGALLGARGNSGVILSQFFQGMARALEGCQEVDSPLLVQAFQEGASSAYRAVSQPVEGTMLTVIEATAQAMQEAKLSGQDDLSGLLQVAVDGCRAAVLQTPEQLPVLKSAGVVDAGGQGFALILEGALRQLQGEEPGAVSIETVLPAATVQESFLTAAESELYGYCTQVMVSGSSLDPDAIRARVSEMADSTVVVGDSTLVKVHAHTFDPGPILSLGVSLGTLSQVKIENIDEQHQEFQAFHRRDRETVPLGVVAVAWGSGIEELFRSLGAGAVVKGGQTMNPSCQELLQAVESLAAETALLLPNNPNIIPAARQAVELCQAPLRVVPTRTIPQGVAALLAYNPEQSIEANEEAMASAAASIGSGEVVTAVREAQVDGVQVGKGSIMGLWEGTLVTSGSSCAEVLEGVIKHAGPGDGSLITLYWGGDVQEAEALECAQRLRQHHTGAEVEVVHGGQPSYHYLVSVE